MPAIVTGEHRAPFSAKKLIVHRTSRQALLAPSAWLRTTVAFCHHTRRSQAEEYQRHRSAEHQELPPHGDLSFPKWDHAATEWPRLSNARRNAQPQRARGCEIGRAHV